MSAPHLLPVSIVSSSSSCVYVRREHCLSDLRALLPSLQRGTYVILHAPIAAWCCRVPSRAALRGES